MGQGVQFFFGISHCTQHTIAVCSVLIALWDFLMQLKSKGHLVSSGFVWVSFPIHTWDFCAMEIKGFCVWFHQVSCQIFPPTTVHNMRLLCRLKSKGSFHRALCCWRVFFFPIIHATTIKTVYAIQIECDFPRVLCCFFAQCQKTQWQKK
jgi:hypothetical protein